MWYFDATIVFFKFNIIMDMKYNSPMTKYVEKLKPYMLINTKILTFVTSITIRSFATSIGATSIHMITLFTV